MMRPYTSLPITSLTFEGKQIASFITPGEKNIHPETIKSFGVEWNRFYKFNEEDIETAGEQYFDIITSEMLNKEKNVLDAGCGSGRWSKYISERADFIEAIDPSDAVYAAAHLTKDISNIRITQASIDNIPFADESFDFIFSLGVMHHLPDTQHAINKVASKLKSKGYFMLYLYYNMDNRSGPFRFLFSISNLLRLIISRLPARFKVIVCDILALLIYIPLIFIARMMKILFPNKKWYQRMPLSYYMNKRFIIIRNDALDRLGTPLEKRFSKVQIEEMMKKAGLKNIVFSNHEPYWHAVGQK